MTRKPDSITEHPIGGEVRTYHLPDGRSLTALHDYAYAPDPEDVELHLWDSDGNVIPGSEEHIRRSAVDSFIDSYFTNKEEASNDRK